MIHCLKFSKSISSLVLWSLDAQKLIQKLLSSSLFIQRMSNTVYPEFPARCTSDTVQLNFLYVHTGMNDLTLSQRFLTEISYPDSLLSKYFTFSMHNPSSKGMIMQHKSKWRNVPVGVPWLERIGICPSMTCQCGDMHLFTTLNPAPVYNTSVLRQA